MYHSFLIHSSASGPLGCFHALAIVNSVVMNIEIHVSFYSGFLGVYAQQWDSWVKKIHWRRDRLPTPVFLGSPVAQLVKKPPAVRETWVQSLGWEDPLEKGKATHSSILAWRIPSV